MKKFSENELLLLLQRKFPGLGAASALGNGDDAALLRVPPDRVLAATVDEVVDGVHFRRDWAKPASIGWKSLAVSASDLAAMGADPLGALVALTLPADIDHAFVDALTDGIAEAAEAFELPVVGGNVTGTPGVLSVAVTALGAVCSPGWRRGAVRPGYRIAVTGTPGLSSFGLAQLLRFGKAVPQEHQAAVRFHHRPEPPLRFARALAARHRDFAAVDTSDSLARSLHLFSANSGVALQLRAPADASHHYWFGGEDYGLLLAFPVECESEVFAMAKAEGVRLTALGEAIAGAPAVFVDAAPLADRGWDALSDALPKG